jgi:hypothetical protein
VLDLDYPEDSDCDTDMNVVMTGSGGIVEDSGHGRRRSHLPKRGLIVFFYADERKLGRVDTDLTAETAGPIPHTG